MHVTLWAIYLMQRCSQFYGFTAETESGSNGEEAVRQVPRRRLVHCARGELAVSTSLQWENAYTGGAVV